MRKIAAHYLFRNSNEPIRQGCVSLTDDGTVAAIEQLNDTEIESTEFYDGILVPGFVNAHCHLELSHLQNKIPPYIGITGFIERMMQGVPHDERQGLVAMQRADKAMHDEGIIAIGDICNNDSSFDIKQQSKIHYHSFLEVVGLPENVSMQRLQKAIQLKETADSMQLVASITPHAAYSMNETAFRHSVTLAKQSGILSIHNQESKEENELFLHCGGSLYHFFVRAGFTPPAPTGTSAIHQLLPLIDESLRILLIHNVVTSEEDFDEALQCSPNIVWVLCPNSNLYINNALPPVELFLRKGANVALGTDSLASNTQLSILEEMKTLQREFPALSFEKILEWATLGGAKALNLDDKLGSITVGKRPGLVLIENFDFEKQQMRDKSTARLIAR